MAINVPQNAIDICAKYEGFRSKPYRCPAGVWTIGYGTTFVPPARVPVTPDTPPVTEEVAKAWLVEELQRCCIQAIALSPNLAGEAMEARLGAIASFIYNLGSVRYRNSTLRRRVNEGNWPEARKEIRKWIWGGGKQLPGLVLRRNEEASYL